MIIEYSQEYEKELIELWNKELYLDKITVEKFRKQVILDENYDSKLSLLYIENNKVIGYILGMKRKFPYLERGLEPDRGWISVMFVDENYQNKGIGTKLITEIESLLQAKGSKRITLAAYSPNYFLSGIDELGYPKSKGFFKKHGYRSGDESYSMSRDLHGFEITEYIKDQKTKAEGNGFRFMTYSSKYMKELLDFAAKEFGGGWKRNLLLAMREDKAEDTVLLVTNKNKEIVGFCMRAIDGNPLRFGPIGISKKARNNGLGGILLEMQMEEMSKRGFYHMFFLSTDIPGKRFYERHGLKVYRTFKSYDKEINL